MHLSCFLENPPHADPEPTLHQSDVQSERQHIVALITLAVFQRKSKGLERINRRHNMLRERTHTNGERRENRRVFC